MHIGTGALTALHLRVMLLTREALNGSISYQLVSNQYRIQTLYSVVRLMPIEVLNSRTLTFGKFMD